LLPQVQTLRARVEHRGLTVADSRRRARLQRKLFFRASPQRVAALQTRRGSNAASLPAKPSTVQPKPPVSQRILSRLQRTKNPTSVPSLTLRASRLRSSRFSIPGDGGGAVAGAGFAGVRAQTVFRSSPFFDLPLLVTIFFGMARAESDFRDYSPGQRSAWRKICWAPIPSEFTASPKTGGGLLCVVTGSEAGCGKCRGAVSGDAGILSGATRLFISPVARAMVNPDADWSWSRGIIAGLANAFLGVGLTSWLDKFKQRT